MEDVTLDQLDKLMTTGTSELPFRSDGGKKEDPPAGKTEETPGGMPAVTEVDGKVEDEVVEETRSAEEIAEAQETARQEVIAAGGDEAAQEAAVEAAGKPVAEVVEEPAVVEEPTEKEDAKRFRVKDPMARAALSIYKAMEEAGTPITLTEAEARVRGPEKKVEEVIQTPALSETVAALEGEVTELETAIDKAGENEGLITKEFTDLTKKLAQKRTALAMAQRDLKQATEQQQAAEAKEAERSKAARATSKAEAFGEFPDAAKKGSKLDLAIQAEIAALSDENHPDNAILYADSAPYLVTLRAAKKLKIAPLVAKAAVPAVKTKVEAPPKTKMSPPSGAKTAVQEGQLSEEAQAKKTIEHLQSPNATVEDLDEFFEPDGKGGTLAAAAAR